MISRMDRDMGRLLAWLRERNLEEDTLVMFISDNGHHREGGNDPDFFDANGPLRGMKRDLYEGGIRVPTLAWWPGTIKAETSWAGMAYFGDLMATVCELTGQEPAAGLSSVSFLPALTGRLEDQGRHPYLYWEFHEGRDKQAVRFGEWKAVRQPFGNGHVELYDLSKDLGERTNRAGQRPDLVQRAAAMMAEAHGEDFRQTERAGR